MNILTQVIYLTRYKYQYERRQEISKSLEKWVTSFQTEWKA